MKSTRQNYAQDRTCSRKKTAQSNHDSFIIPPSLQQYADEPLYILVALWGRQLNDWLSRTEIAKTFGITERRASFQLSYLSRQKKRVDCEVRAIRAENSPRFHHEVKINIVVLTRDVKKAVSAPTKKGPVKSSKVGNATPELRNLLRTLMGARRRCEG